MCTFLRHSSVRLLTLTGPGGVGKTRLGLQIATNLLEDFADGVCFVPLAPIRDADLVASAIAEALGAAGLTEMGERVLLERLESYLRDKHLLLLLDNFEQVVMTGPMLAHLLAACPHVKILVTSPDIWR